MLGFLRRSAFDTHDQRARKLLYLSLVRRNFVYCSQVWTPQAVNLILDIERFQRRATKFILSLPHRSHVNFKQRLLKIGLLPLCYWHECLDLVYVFKCLVSLSDPIISVVNFTRPRRTVSSKGQYVTFENSFYCRALRIPWNTLPAHLLTLTVQKRTSRKIFLITTCISLSLFMRSTPPDLHECVY